MEERAGGVDEGVAYKLGSHHSEATAREDHREELGSTEGGMSECPRPQLEQTTVS